MAEAISVRVRYFPVPTMSRERKVRPPILSAESVDMSLACSVLVIRYRRFE